MKLKILDAYVLSLYAMPFLVAQAALVLFVGASQSDVPGRIDWSNQVLTSPLAAVIAACLTFSDLAKGGKLMALNAAGISMRRIILAPTALTIVVIAAFAFLSGVLSTVGS